MIAVINYGVGNLGSIANMLRKIRVSAEVTSDPKVIAGASGLLLPGVGAFDHGMEMLDRSGLRPLLESRVLEAKVPILGICLGMQMLTQGSEEGERPGLGWIKAHTRRFDASRLDPKQRIPHMGWNIVAPRRSHPLTDSLPDETRFYFVHSYHVVCEDEADSLMTTPYGYNFTSSVANGNITGVQFHPEKSHRFGMTLLECFARMADSAPERGVVL